MDVPMWTRRTTLVLALTLVAMLGRETLCAEGERTSANQNETPELHSLRVVDFFNLFPNVGAFVVWGEPNDFGAPEGLLTRCTGTLIRRACVPDRRSLRGLDQGGHAPAIHQVLRDLQPECSRAIGLAARRRPRHPPIPASLSSAGPLHVPGPRPRDSGHRPDLPQRTRPGHRACDARPARYPEKRSSRGCVDDSPGLWRPGLRAGRRASAQFRMGWLASNQDFEATPCRGQRVGELVPAWRGLFWRLGVAHFSFRPVPESTRQRDCCGGERRWRRLFLAGRSRSRRHARGPRVGAKNHRTNDPKALRAQSVDAGVVAAAAWVCGAPRPRRGHSKVRSLRVSLRMAGEPCPGPR